MPATTETFNLASTTVSNPSNKIYLEAVVAKQNMFLSISLYCIGCWCVDDRISGFQVGFLSTPGHDDNNNFMVSDRF